MAGGIDTLRLLKDAGTGAILDTYLVRLANDASNIDMAGDTIVFAGKGGTGNGLASDNGAAATAFGMTIALSGIVNDTSLSYETYTDSASWDTTGRSYVDTIRVYVYKSGTATYVPVLSYLQSGYFLAFITKGYRDVKSTILTLSSYLGCPL